MLLKRLIIILSVVLYISGPVLAKTANAESLQVIEIKGDQDIKSKVVWENAHYKVSGNVNLHTGGKLTVRNAVVELMCKHSREYNFWWKGGKLETKKVTIGGTKQNEKVQHCNFNLHNGEWISIDTTVRYTYGQTFSPRTVGKLRGLRHNAGPNSDAIIIDGKGDVLLKDSTFAIALTTHIDKSKTNGDFSMPINKTMNIVYDSKNVPGAEYRLELKNTKVPFWWLFVKGVTMDDKPREIILRDCPNFVSSVTARNLTGKLSLPCKLGNIQNLPANSKIKVGNLTFRTLDKPAGIFSWGMYIMGEDTDLTFVPPTYLGELMIWEGTVRLIGKKGEFTHMASATTIDVGRFWDKKHNLSTAKLFIENAYISPLAKWKITGHITVCSGSKVEIRNSKLHDVGLMTKDKGTIDMHNVKMTGAGTKTQNGGPITVH